MNDGILIVLSGPSGSGKDTILNEVLKEMPEEAFLSVSMTTRKMRQGEAEGINYYYVSEAEFENHIHNNEMLEYAKYGQNYYGTPLGPVKKLLSEGKVIFLNIEVQGGGYVKELIPEAVKVFIMPPSMEILENRLRRRGTETDEAIESRMAIAKTEITRATEYDYIVFNDELSTAVNDVKSIIRAEQLKHSHMKNKLSEVIKNA